MRKLEGKIDFQGLHISIETDKGSSREWHDPHGTKGTTTFEYPYGYVKGTLGTDGDAVDVFVGPNKDSTRIFIITQMKTPDFKEVDEQKVMLGFNSSKEAKSAYLRHYDNPKFFGSMKELDLASFKEKLETQRGKLIKGLYDATFSASIHKTPNGDTVAKSESAIEILKSLTSRMLSTVAPRPQRQQSVEPTGDSALYGPQVAQAAHRDRPFEQPVQPTAYIDTPAQVGPRLSPDFMTSCGSCGYTHKSLNSCPRCENVQAQARTATPIWRR